MSTLSKLFAEREKAAKKKTKAKRDEQGRFVKKDDPDLETPSL